MQSCVLHITTFLASLGQSLPIFVHLVPSITNGHERRRLSSISSRLIEIHHDSLKSTTMLFNTRHMAILASISILANALPFDIPRQLVQRQKNYSVINVDGGESAQATTVVEPTKTVEVVNPGPTITQEVTTTVVNAAPAPTTASSSSESTRSTPSITSTPTISATPSSTSKPIETPKPIFVTITIPKDDGPTEYYDDGLWHTHYRVKTFEAAVATKESSASIPTQSSSVEVPVLETSTPSYN
jgi:hypothetical protein